MSALPLTNQALCWMTNYSTPLLYVSLGVPGFPKGSWRSLDALYIGLCLLWLSYPPIPLQEYESGYRTFGLPARPVSAVVQKRRYLSMFLLATFCVAFVALAVYRLAIICYRLSFHPLRHIPGPKIAAITTLYESYYDLVKSGQFSIKVWDLHKQHGPIIRIGPDEVHVLDPDFIDKVYSMQGRWNKNQGYKRYGNLGHLATIPHALHKTQRGHLNPFFSKQRIATLEPRIQALIPRMERRLDEFARSRELLDIELFFSAVTMDVGSEYAMGKAYGNLDMPDFNKHYHGMVPRMGPVWNLSKQLPWLPAFFERLPSDWLRRLEPGMISFKDFGMHCELEIRNILSMQKASPSPKVNADPDTSPTIFHAMLSNADLAATEESIEYMRDEAIVIIGAATVTTSMTFTMIFFHLAHKPAMLARLRDELDGVTGDRPFTLRQIEQLPYLNAVIEEALRSMPGGPNRVGRIAVDHATTYTQLSKNGTTVEAEYVIPPGYELSMTQWHLSRNPHVFERADEFIPERWTEVDAEGRLRLEKAYAPFVKGTRNCLGMNLAYAELRLLTAALASGPFDFVPFESQINDWELVAESGPSPIMRKQFRAIVERQKD